MLYFDQPLGKFLNVDYSNNMDDNFNDPNDQLAVIVNSKQFMQFLNTL